MRAGGQHEVRGCVVLFFSLSIVIEARRMWRAPLILLQSTNRVRAAYGTGLPWGCHPVLGLDASWFAWIPHHDTSFHFCLDLYKPDPTELISYTFFFFFFRQVGIPQYRHISQTVRYISCIQVFRPIAF